MKPYKISCFENYSSITSNFVSHENHSSKHVGNVENFNTERFKGIVTSPIKKKMRIILDTWFTAVFMKNMIKNKKNSYKNPYLVFLTLTLSEEQKDTDKWIKRHLLNEFFIILKRHVDFSHYFWKAEKQKNGNVHFHVIVDKYIQKEKLQKIWNRIQEKNGYTQKYFSVHGHHNPPSTDIRKIDSMKNAINYVMKYVTKNSKDENEKDIKLDGRVYGCDDDLRILENFKYDISINELENLRDYLSSKKMKIITNEYNIILICPLKTIQNYLGSLFKKKYYEYFGFIFDFLYETVPAVSII